MKKLLSVILAVIMLFSLAAPAFAAVDIYATRSQTPIVVISGDGGNIMDKDGKQLSKLSKFFTNNGDKEEEEDDEMNNILSSVANVIWPLLYNGLLTGDYEPYYAALQNELSDLFGDMILDENGEASNGSHIDPWGKEQNDFDMVWDRKWGKDFYLTEDYHFWYDWRLDPMFIADQLNDYIKGVKNITGAEKVGLLSRCLGTNVVCAYIAKYGTDDICGFGFDGAVCMGAEPISESISGKFKVDGAAIERILLDGNSIGLFDIDPLIVATLDLAQKSGAFDTLVGVGKDLVYEKLVEGVTSAVALAAISYPGYWACVKPEDFDTAVDYVFGREGSEKRVKYAGMIEKITRYNEEVKKNIPEILMSIKEKGINVGVIAKYGLQLVPTCESRTAVADSFVSCTSSSFGATTGTVYSKLSSSYIEEQTAKGLEKYISPDKQVDASTCLFPDSTWFIKGVKHSEWTEAENMLLTTVIIADRQLTVEDFNETQFMVRDPENQSRMTAMTTENCNTENWKADENVDNRTDKFTYLFSFLKSLFTWLKLIFQKITAAPVE